MMTAMDRGKTAVVINFEFPVFFVFLSWQGRYEFIFHIYEVYRKVKQKYGFFTMIM